MPQRFLVSVGFACCLAFVVIFGQTPLHAYTPHCYVYSNMYAYNYGNPPPSLGGRYDTDDWHGAMTIFDCAVTLSQNAVKQWGNELCDQHSAGFVVIDWNYAYYDSNGIFHGDYFSQQWDCGDLP
jgi:hypothetical protein